MNKAQEAQKKYGLDQLPACVLADGPYELDGDGAYDYVVCFGNEEGEPIGDRKSKGMWSISSFDEMWNFAWELAEKFGLECIVEATHA